MHSCTCACKRCGCKRVFPQDFVGKLKSICKLCHPRSLGLRVPALVQKKTTCALMHAGVQGIPHAAACMHAMPAKAGQRWAALVSLRWRLLLPLGGSH